MEQNTAHAVVQLPAEISDKPFSLDSTSLQRLQEIQRSV